MPDGMASNSALVQIRKFLNDQDIPFREVHHIATHTSEESAIVRGESLSKGAKALLIKVNTDFWLFVIPADRRLETSLVKDYFKESIQKVKKFRFASADELEEMTGLVPGCVPPFGKPILPFDIIVDSHLFEEDEIAFNAGSLTDSIFLRTKDYRSIFGGQIANISSKTSTE